MFLSSRSSKLDSGVGRSTPLAASQPLSRPVFYWSIPFFHASIFQRHPAVVVSIYSFVNILTSDLDGCAPSAEACGESCSELISWDLKCKKASRGNGGLEMERNRGGNPTQASISEACGPIMALTSAARRGRGHDVRAD